MVALPAWVWRFGLVVRALISAFALGVVVGLLALFGSNLVLAGIVACVTVTVLYAPFMARRMSKYWPGAKALSGADRVSVVSAARDGRDIGDLRLASGVIEYTQALHAAAERRLWRWAVVLLGVVALGTAIMDTIFAPVGEVVVSWLYFAFFPIEAWWWPRRQERLLANADRAADTARKLLP